MKVPGLFPEGGNSDLEDGWILSAESGPLDRIAYVRGYREQNMYSRNNNITV